MRRGKEESQEESRQEQEEGKQEEPPLAALGSTTTLVFDRHTTRRVVEQAVALLHGICQSCYFFGQGRARFVSINEHKSYLTRRSTRLFQHVFPKNPIARLLIDSATAHVARFGDGGLFLILLTCHLIRRYISEDSIQRITEEGLRPFRPHEAVQYCRQLLLRKECPCVVELSWSNPEPYLQLVRGVLDAKHPQLPPETRRKLSIVLFKAFVHAAPRCVGQRLSVRYAIVPGGDEVDVQFVAGCVVNKPLPEGAWPLLERNRNSNIPCRVLIFSTSLLFQHATFKADDRTNSCFIKESREAMLAFANHIAMLEVTLLGCQMLIHPFLQVLLLQRGIVPWERLSLEHISSVSLACGGIQSLAGTLLGLITPAHVGALTALWPIRVGRRTLVHLEPATADIARVVTIIAGSLLEDELRDSLRASIQVLVQTLGLPKAFRGGGFTERWLAVQLEQHARYRRLSRALQDVIGETQESKPSEEHEEVLDSFMGKLAAIDAAVALAVTVGQDIDGIIVNKT